MKRFRTNCDICGCYLEFLISWEYEENMKYLCPACREKENAIIRMNLSADETCQRLRDLKTTKGLIF